MSLGVFDTHLGAQGTEGICELQEYLVPLLKHCGPSSVLVIIVSNGVILFLDGIHKRVPRGIDPKYFRIISIFFLTVSLDPPKFYMGTSLRSAKVIYSLLEKLLIEK
jgi:hypothetical protein